MRPPPHHLDLLLAIEHEAHTIAGTSRLDATLDRIRAEFQSHVIIKRGERLAIRSRTTGLTAAAVVSSSRGILGASSGSARGDKP